LINWSGIEIGVLFGGHALEMLKNECLEILIGIDPYKLYEQDIYGLDNQDDYDAVYEFALNRLSDSRYFHFRGTSDSALGFLNDGSKYDFVFIDGLHTYDQCRKDLINYSKLIRKGGIVACHDYDHPNFPGVTDAIKEFATLHNAKINIGYDHTIYMDKTW
jgi:hypothetical protein